MPNEIIAALIGVGGTVLGLILTPVLNDWIDVFKVRSQHIPSLEGTWHATWYVSDGLTEIVYATDLVQISKHRGVRLLGSGADPRGPYQILGRVNSHGVVTFSYDFGLLLYALVGGGVLLPNPTFDELNGLWHGYLQDRTLSGGRVVWSRNAPVSLRDSSMAKQIAGAQP